LMPNHEHICVTPTRANLPDFLRDLHHWTARFVQEWLLDLGYDAPRSIWDSRPTHVMRLVGADAIAASILYQHRNCVEAGLVDRTVDYPGWASPLCLLRGGDQRLVRPDLFYSGSFPDEITVRHSRVPDLVRAVGSDHDTKLIYWLERHHEQYENDKRAERKRKGRTVLGPDIVRAIHPFAEPVSPRERRGRRWPSYRIGALATPEQTREVVQACRREKREFIHDHEHARIAGDPDVLFPAGTYLMRVQHGAQVAEPRPGAILTAPGELLPERLIEPEHTVHDVLDNALSLLECPDDPGRYGQEWEVEDLRRVTCLSVPAELAIRVAVSTGSAKTSAEDPKPRTNPEAPASPASSNADPTSTTPVAPRPLAPATADPPATAEPRLLQSPARTAFEPHPARIVTLRTRRWRTKRSSGDPPR
ncbi:MAG: hypothetical protein OEY14_09950, partial [Myxococcales bacterium]|nr:hypothetical protein [Myxococcales bacterium]